MKDLGTGAAQSGNGASGFWWEAARCVGRPELFFPPDRPEPDQLRRKRERTAIDLCRRCSVRARCLDYALGHDIRSGIWGGRTERDRAELAGGRREPGKPGEGRP